MRLNFKSQYLGNNICSEKLIKMSLMTGSVLSETATKSTMTI